MWPPPAAPRCADRPLDDRPRGIRRQHFLLLTSYYTSYDRQEDMPGCHLACPPAIQYTLCLPTYLPTYEHLHTYIYTLRTDTKTNVQCIHGRAMNLSYGPRTHLNHGLHPHTRLPCSPGCTSHGPRTRFRDAEAEPLVSMRPSRLRPPA